MMKRVALIKWQFVPEGRGGEEAYLHPLPLSFKMDQTGEVPSSWSEAACCLGKEFVLASVQVKGHSAKGINLWPLLTIPSRPQPKLVEKL